MAPEILNPPDDFDHNVSYTEVYTTESDVYSLGMTILEVMTGNVPFAHRKNSTWVVVEVTRGERPQRPNEAIVTDGVWAILSASWNANALERPTAQTVEAWLMTEYQLDIVRRRVDHS